MGIFGQQARNTVAARRTRVLCLAPLLLAACSRKPAGPGERTPAHERAERGTSQAAASDPAGRARERAGEPADEVAGLPALQALPPVPGCGLTGHEDTGAAKGQGGTLRVHLPHEPPHLNPLADTLEVVDRVTRGLIYETLLECPGSRYQPGLAESWTVVARRDLDLTCGCAPGVLWHDQRTVTAIDAQASVEAVLRSSSRLSATRASLADVTAGGGAT